MLSRAEYRRIYETGFIKELEYFTGCTDTCEQLGLPEREDFMTLQGPQISEWEPLPELKHLQLLFSEHPYWGRELRYFNDAPWWYKKEFELALGAEEHIELCFTNVDYYCKVWLNGVYLGSHEGYSAPFSFSLDEAVPEKRKEPTDRKSLVTMG